MTSRRKTRELALGCVYEAEVGKHDIDTVIERTITGQDVKGSAKDFLRDAVMLTWNRRDVIDPIIEDLAEGWKLDRIARVDLAILRLAVVELLFGIEDPRPADPIVINEAVVLAKKFSTDDSGKFINGILATVLKKKDSFLKRIEEKSGEQEKSDG